MTPYYSDDWLTVYQGDCREVMAQMEPESVHTVVTSPPYWGLRDYGIGGQLGLEPTPEEYVANMVAVFRQVRRVLRSDGTCWVNLGDSYAGSGKGGNPADSQWSGFVGSAGREDAAKAAPPIIPPGLKPKDLVGIPWRVAFALQADGWYLRSDIIWAKPNPMPESVTDRPTKAHEYLFLLSKSPRYFFDGEAVRRPISPYNVGRVSVAPHGEHVATNGHRQQEVREYDEIKGANIRTVWEIATQPYPGAHFATFPEKLVEPCVKAGTSERGVCPECGAPWVPIIERTTGRDWNAKKRGNDRLVYGNGTGADMDMDRIANPPRKTGWQQSCAHNRPDENEWTPVPAVVLDPFAGSGTTGRVAQRLGRRAVLIDLSGDYLVQAMRRNTEIPLGLETA